MILVDYEAGERRAFNEQTYLWEPMGYGYDVYEMSRNGSYRRKLASGNGYGTLEDAELAAEDWLNGRYGKNGWEV